MQTRTKFEDELRKAEERHNHHAERLERRFERSLEQKDSKMVRFLLKFFLEFPRISSNRLPCLMT